MKMKLVAATLIGMSMSTFVAASAALPAAGTNSKPTSLSNDKDKLSYSIGADLGVNFKKQGIDINPTVMAMGLQDGVSGDKLLLTEEQMKDVLSKFQKDLIAKRSAEFNQQAKENKAKGDAFLNENKGKPNVVTLPSGLQYKIVTAGNGAKPSKEDTVTVEYTGQLINGQVFDSTDKAGKPATFKVSQVIPGWTEALQMMPAGSTWEVYVPADLAYGPRNIGGSIGPNETLIFKIHLISVKKAGE